MVRFEAYPDVGGALEAPTTTLMPTTATAIRWNDFFVDQDGWVLFPVVGLIRVAGRPWEDVRTDVERAFTAQFMGAAVRIIPLMRVAVIGEVRTPGLLPVDPTMSLADVIAAAGGLTEAAKRNDIRLVRAGETLLVSDEEDLTGVLVRLRSADRVVVARRSWASQNLPLLLGAGASVVASVLTSLIIR
jgi:protein involved in polysaccharide export with SLBB domain